ncbi:MAG: hypothetical protein CMP47_14405 [Rickettsiales bacterium]|nr:hypothetical protein [Rickettsiales bacterium]
MVPQAGTRLTGGFLTESFAGRLRRRRLGDWFDWIYRGGQRRWAQSDVDGAGRVPASWIKDYL